jgi:hypothetical protein
MLGILSLFAIISLLVYYYEVILLPNNSKDQIKIQLIDSEMKNLSEAVKNLSVVVKDLSEVVNDLSAVIKYLGIKCSNSTSAT